MITKTEIHGGGKIHPDGSQYGRALVATTVTGETRRFKINSGGRVSVAIGHAYYWFQVHGDERDTNRLNEALEYVAKYA